jgi:hypothetical protein
MLFASWTSREKSECQYGNMLPCNPQERDSSIDNLLVRIEMIR